MRKKRLILVDDEADFLEIAKTNLQMARNFEILTLENAKDIVSQVHAFKPDIILMDIVMPDIDGIQASKILRQDPEGSKIPIIILSALEYDEVIKDAKNTGINDYVLKPINTNDLINRINKVLDVRS